MKKSLKKTCSLLICLAIIISTLSVFAVSSSADVLVQTETNNCANIVGTYKVEDGFLKLKLELSDNPGLNTVLLKLGYDSRYVEFEGIENGEVFCEATGGSLFPVNAENNPLVLYFEENQAGNVTANGTLAELTFKIKNAGEVRSYKFDLQVVDMFAAGENQYGAAPVDVENEKAVVSFGDTDGNGKVNIGDIWMIKAVIVKLVDESKYNKAYVDVDGDGEITAKDSLLVVYYVLGK